MFTYTSHFYPQGIWRALTWLFKILLKIFMLIIMLIMIHDDNNLLLILISSAILKLLSLSLSMPKSVIRIQLVQFQISINFLRKIIFRYFRINLRFSAEPQIKDATVDIWNRTNTHGLPAFPMKTCYFYFSLQPFPVDKWTSEQVKI